MRRGALFSDLLFDNQPRNNVLLVEVVHLEIVHVKKPNRREGMICEHVVTSLVDFICHQPEVNLHSQYGEIVDLCFRIDVPSPEVKFMHLCVVE